MDKLRKGKIETEADLRWGLIMERSDIEKRGTVRFTSASEQGMLFWRVVLYTGR